MLIESLFLCLCTGSGRTFALRLALRQLRRLRPRLRFPVLVVDGLLQQAESEVLAELQHQLDSYRKYHLGSPVDTQRTNLPQIDFASSLRRLPEVLAQLEAYISEQQPGKDEGQQEPGGAPAPSAVLVLRNIDQFAPTATISIQHKQTML